MASFTSRTSWKSRKLHHPWTGPWQVVKRLSDAVYRLRSQTGRRCRVVVHFDRLKRCTPGIRFTTDGDALPPPQTPQLTSSMPPPFNPEIVDDDEQDTPTTPPASQPPPLLPRRYHVRSRQAPDHYSGYFST